MCKSLGMTGQSPPGTPLRLTEAEFRILSLLATAPGRLGERARIVLAAAAIGSGNATTESIKNLNRTEARWRSRFERHRVAGLLTPAPCAADMLLREQTILQAVTSPGAEPATATALAERLGEVLSQSTISQVWRKAGFTPPPPGILIADPWFAGRARTLVGLLAIGGAPADAPGDSDPAGDRVIPSGLMLAVFAASVRDPTNRSKESELRRTAMLSGRQQTFDECLAVARIAARLGERKRCVLDEQAAVDAIGFLSRLRDEVPSDLVLHVAASVPPGPVLEVWAQQHPAVELRYTPTAAAWTALFARSTAATVSVLEARRLPSPIPDASARLRAQYVAPEPFTCGSWSRTDEVAEVIASLSRRWPRPPRAAPRVPTWQTALRELRERRSTDFPADLPAYEFLMALRRRHDVEPLVKSDFLAALVVWEDLSKTRDRLEAELIAFNLDLATNATQSETAPALGVTAPSAVGMRRRRLASGSAGRRRGRRRATPDPREQIVLDGRGRRRDLVADTVEELQARWVDDLADREDLIERIPSRDDTYGMLAYIVDPRRPIARHVDPELPTPTERRQADGRAGLLLANDVYHRIKSERAAWFDLAREHGLTWTEIGAALGKTRSGAFKERVALAREFSGHGKVGASDRVSDVPPYWKDYVDDLRQHIAGFAGHADYFANDESIRDWLDLLDFTSATPGRRQFTFFLELVEELVSASQCEGCDRPLQPIATDDSGRRLCIRCHERGEPDLAELASAATVLRRTLIAKRRASASAPP